METILELRKVSMIFSKGFFRPKLTYAVSDVSCSIHNGEKLVLAGESGCGKTTLGKIAVGILKPTTGEVLYKGKDIWKMNKEEFKEFRPKAQLIHQDPYASINPVRTIYQNLAPVLRKYGTKRNLREEVKSRLERLGIVPADYFIDKFPHHLSGGLRQRLAIARSLIPDPEFLVADEPISMIDASLKISVLNLLLEANAQGVALLYITHDLASAKYMGVGGKIAVMYLGRIVEMGDVVDVYKSPLHPYFQALLSCQPVPDPRLERKRKRLKLKSAEPPSAERLPSGCAFHPRCPYAESICSEETPELREHLKGRLVACHLAEEIPKWTPIVEE